MARPTISNKVTLLKKYLLVNGIEQMHIHHWTKLSLHTVNKLVGNGEGNGSTKKLIFLFLKTKDASLTERKFEQMLKLIPKKKMFQ